MVKGALRAADLFSGAGGLSEGFRQAGYQIMAGTDVDPDACATYALNFPEADTVPGVSARGKCGVTLPGEGHTRQCEPQAGGGSGCGSSNGGGMATYSFHSLLASLHEPPPIWWTP